MRPHDLATEHARGQVAGAIAAAESTTAGEIVVVIAPRCDDYVLVPLAWAAIVALAVPPVLYWLFWLSPVTIYAATIATFAFLALVLGLWPVRLAVTPRAVRRKHARRCAREQFLTQELYTTRGRTGVLIFVALAERYCEILADTAIAERVAPEAWRGIIDRLLAEIRAGRAVAGLVGAVSAAGTILAEHFPPGADNPDALPDHLIVLPVWPP
jgi:putative membrane protein